tara:strand:- start:253 stop:522 length:270 start_codon:yes stop_codon:yes gene_type:complete
MSNKFENKALKQINTIDLIIERKGLMARILKYFLKPKITRALKALEKDPEWKATISDLNYQTEKLKDMLDNVKDDPDIDPRLKSIAKYL